MSYSYNRRPFSHPSVVVNPIIWRDLLTTEFEVSHAYRIKEQLNGVWSVNESIMTVCIELLGALHRLVLGFNATMCSTEGFTIAGLSDPAVLSFLPLFW